MNDLFSVKDKVIILTGGSGFLGSQFNQHLTSCGAKVVVFDNQADNPVDITNPVDIKKLWIKPSRNINELTEW